MWWLWIVGPLAVAILYLVTDWRDKRRENEVEQWRAGMGARAKAARTGEGARDGKKAAAKRVTALPGPLARILLAAGGGARFGYFELVPKLAYLAVMGGDATSGSDHQTVVARLDEPVPTFMVRPLPILEGQRETNTGIQFKKDPDFMDQFQVDRALDPGAVATGNEADDKAIRKWLSPPVREALMDLPDVWLRVEGKTLALTLYGPPAADKINELITAADIVFAEYGAEGGPSLFGDEDEEDAAPAPAKGAKGAGGSSGKKSAAKSA